MHTSHIISLPVAITSKRIWRAMKTHTLTHAHPHLLNALHYVHIFNAVACCLFAIIQSSSPLSLPPFPPVATVTARATVLYPFRIVYTWICVLLVWCMRMCACRSYMCTISMCSRIVFLTAHMHRTQIDIIDHGILYSHGTSIRHMHMCTHIGWWWWFPPRAATYTHILMLR